MSEKKLSPWVKVALDLGPLVIFLIAYSRLKDGQYEILGRAYSGFILATALFIPLIAISTFAQWKLSGKVSAMQIATLVLVLIFGGLSVWLNDPTFFKMKPTIMYLFFAAILGAGLVRGRAWLQLVMEEVLPMTHEGWMILTRRFVMLFLGLAVTNEIVWRTMSDGVWIVFKIFGLPIILMAFITAQARLFARYGIEKKDDGTQ